MSGNALFKQRGFTLIELLVVIVIIGILAAIALPNYIKVKEKAKEAEVKANLHNIQLSVERFAVDTEGAYPNYLIGGEAKYSEVTEGSSANSFSNVQICDPLEGVSDPLLRKGYIDAYPRCPFTRNGISIHQVQKSMPRGDGGTSDPLRNSSEFNQGQTQFGTRFGPYCTSMGSVLADPRFAVWTYTHPQDGTYENRPTFANVVYKFWDMWRSNKPLPFLPGQFFYKSSGPIMATGLNTARGRNWMADAGNIVRQGAPQAGNSAPTQPIEIDSYMLGGYGGIRTKGKDPLGPEQPIRYATDSQGSGGGPPPPPGPNNPPAASGAAGSSGVLLIWPWTRSDYDASGANGEYQGSPFAPATEGDGTDQLSPWNPNAIRDGIILVLTAGTDFDHTER